MGPILFAIFFDDSDQNDDESIHNLNFADDKKKAVVVNDINDAHKLQTSIDKFMGWCDENGLSVNLSKCKILTFTHKKSPIIYSYTINGQPIERVSEIRDLVIIHET